MVVVVIVNDYIDMVGKYPRPLHSFEVDAGAVVGLDT